MLKNMFIQKKFKNRKKFKNNAKSSDTSKNKKKIRSKIKPKQKFKIHLFKQKKNSKKVFFLFAFSVQI